MRKIIGIALVVIALADLGFSLYSNTTNAMHCNQFMQQYIKNPPTDVEDYTQRDVAFDEWCDPTYAYIGYGGGFVALILGGALIGKKKKRIGRP